ncbi:MAG: Arc family DNA-binding protein [Lachnospira sp.]|nr:Arc family DNA-binding protein [Lachnospira sp.]
MSYKISKFTLRIESELLKKFRFVAEYNARSANREISTLINNHVKEFEKKNGKIIL